jgi:hypothetical protein
MVALLQTLVAYLDDTSDETQRSGMGDPSASVESSSAAPPSSTFPLPDADLVTAAWTDLPAGGGFAARPDKAKSLSRAMLALGAGLLLFVPLSGALFLAAGVLGLAIASEVPVRDSSGGTPSVTTNAATAAIQPQPSSPTDQ